MNAERFAAILEAYGADARRWPAAECASAEVFAATPEGRRRLTLAVALDEVLDSHWAPPPSAELRLRVLDARPNARPRLPVFGSWARAWGAGMAAAVMAGVAFGAVLSLNSGALDPRTATLLTETEAYEVAALGLDGDAL